MKRSLVVLAAGVVGAFALGSPVQADHGVGGSSLSQSADATVCGQVTLSGTNVEHLGNGNPMAFGIVWTTEDGQAGVFGVPGEHVVMFDEDVNGGSVWVSFGISVGAESDWYLPHDTATVDTDCEPEPSPSPTPEPTVSASPEPTVEPTTDPAPGQAGGSDTDADKPGLPVTGSAPLKLAAAAGGLGAAGLAAVVLPVWWQRRRRNALLGELTE